MLNLKHVENFQLTYILPSMESGYVEQTIPDKPTSRSQRYRLTPKGIQLVAEIQKGQ